MSRIALAVPSLSLSLSLLSFVQLVCVFQVGQVSPVTPAGTSSNSWHRLVSLLCLRHRLPVMTLTYLTWPLKADDGSAVYKAQTQTYTPQDC